MSVTSRRNISVTFSGDETLEINQSTLDNVVSPGEADLTSLIIGNNVIAAPVISGIVVTGVTIIPPAGNLNLITLKGTGTDAGIALHLTDPSSIALDITFVSLVLSVTVAVNGVRLIWS